MPRRWQQDEPPLAGDEHDPCLQVPVPEEPSSQTRPCVTPSLWGVAPTAALSPGTTLTGGPKHAAAGLCQHGHRGGRAITEELVFFFLNCDYAKINQEKQSPLSWQPRHISTEETHSARATGINTAAVTGTHTWGHHRRHRAPKAGAILRLHRPSIYCCNHPTPQLPHCTRWSVFHAGLSGTAGTSGSAAPASVGTPGR